MELNKVDVKRLRSEVSGEHRDTVHWARANRKGLAEYLTAIAPWGGYGQHHRPDTAYTDPYNPYH